MRVDPLTVFAMILQSAPEMARDLVLRMKDRLPVDAEPARRRSIDTLLRYASLPLHRRRELGPGHLVTEVERARARMERHLSECVICHVSRQQAFSGNYDFAACHVGLATLRQWGKTVERYQQLVGATPAWSTEVRP